MTPSDPTPEETTNATRAVDCPTCGAQTGEQCLCLFCPDSQPMCGTLKVHAARVDAWRESETK